jgi:hypothetical protein
VVSLINQQKGEINRRLREKKIYLLFSNVEHIVDDNKLRPQSLHG